jgi:thioredoxin 1
MAIITVTNTNFEQAVLKASGPVLLDFWAPWCGPCKMIAPILEAIAAEDESVTIAKVNVDEEMELAMRFGITSIPTLVVMEGGKAVNKAIGYRSKDSILELLGK